VGPPQEQARHELRDDGSRSQVLLPERHPGQGGRSETRLPVCRCSQDRRHRRGGVLRSLSTREGKYSA